MRSARCSPNHVSMNQLHGKVALITGASKGLGRAIALAFAREGAALALCARGGAVDVLVNNASTLGPTPLPLLVDTDPHAFDDVVRVNLTAPFLISRSLVGAMLLRGSGVVINVSSDAAVNGYPGWGGYSAAKAGLDALTRVWAAELAGSG